MLHIVNGDATAARLAPAALPGDVLVWRDILIEGPVARDLDVDVLAAGRVPWLARQLGIDADAYMATARAEAEGLARALAHDELVLWFEQDLFCVANLGHLAAWLRRTRPRGRVSLVFPAAPLGAAEPADLAAAFAARAPFTDGEIARAAGWWDAYAAPDPGAFATPRAAPDRLGFLAIAWSLHLARFPALGNGLGTVETAALAALGDAPRPLADVFRTATRDERMRAHGMGDLQFAAYVRALAAGATPLATVADEGSQPSQMTVTMTETGRAVLAGTRDRLDVQALDWWLGGVHLVGRRAPWRWDPRTARLVREDR